MPPRGFCQDSHYQQLTPIGTGGIAVFLLNGLLTQQIIEHHFKTIKAKPQAFEIGTFYYGKLYDNAKNMIDEVIISFPEKDTIEIHSHGGITSVRLLQALLQELGFTEKDLSTNTGLEKNIHPYYRQALQTIQTAREYNFLQQQIPLYQTYKSHCSKFTKEEIINLYKEMLKHYQIESQQREQKYLCLCGLPNAGKSSLINAITGKNRAIVSNIVRTTRDTVTEDLFIHGYHFRILDTAGLHQPDNILDEASVKQTYENIEHSHCVLWLHDSCLPFTQEEERYLQTIKKKLSSQSIHLLLTKSDMAATLQMTDYPDIFTKVFSISSLHNTGIENMLNEIIQDLFKTNETANGIAALSDKMAQDIQEAYTELEQKVDLQPDDLTISRHQLNYFLNAIPL